MSILALKQAFDGSGSPLGRRFPLAALALAAASVIWLPSLHLFFRPGDAFSSPKPLPAKAGALAARHLALWTDSDLRAKEIQRMRATNAEWDFMGRTFFVLALSNMALSELELDEAHA